MTASDESVSAPTTSVSIEFQESKAAAVNYRLGHRYYSKGKTILRAGQRFRRLSYGLPDHNMEILADDFGKNTICEFTRLAAKGENHLLLNFPDEYDVMMTQGTGWLFRSRYCDKYHYWLPLQPMARNYDRFGRIVREEALPVIKIDILSNESCAIFRIPEDNDLIEFVVWTLPAKSPLFEELHSLSPTERQSIFLWGSYDQCKGPKDLYQHLIHGAVYKTGLPGTAWPWRRSYCEVVAHALYVTFHSLWKITGKKIYQLLKTQIVFSVIARQESDGAWRHGSWTEDFEVHYRHHCSGIHMLAADYDETKDALVGSSLKRAVGYLRNQIDALSVGNWYLHDSLELSVETMRKCPVTYQYSRVLGKSPSNMLVLNTHLDALVALNRYEEVSGQRFPEEEIASGVNATVAVLGLKPAEALYRILFKAIELTFLPDSTVNRLSFPMRALRRLARQRLIPYLPRIKRMFPRLVMPNGYIDRNLSLNEFWYPYFLINIMDLLRFQMRFSTKEIDPIIENALRFVERVGLEKWLNDESTAYGVGFWAEALYIYCLRNPDRSRDALAKAVISLCDSEQGIPPSLLGGNSEFIRLNDQVPCISTDIDGLRIINLSVHPHHLEFLIVNGTESPQDTSIPRVHDKLMVFDQNDHSISSGQRLTVPARNWVRLLSRKI